MDKQHAFQIWEECFGDVTTAYDFASHPMKKEDYQNQESHYGWDIDIKKPYLNREDNFLPCSLNTMGFRQGKPSFKVGNHIFEVRKGRVYGTFSIYDITDRNHPINMDPSSENQDPDYNRQRFHEIAQSQRSNKPVFNIPSMASITRNVFNESLHDTMESDSEEIFDHLDTKEKEVQAEPRVVEETKEEPVAPEVPVREETLAQEESAESVSNAEETHPEENTVAETPVAEQAPAQEETPSEPVEEPSSMPQEESSVVEEESTEAEPEPDVEEKAEQPENNETVEQAETNLTTGTVETEPTETSTAQPQEAVVEEKVESKQSEEVSATEKTAEATDENVSVENQTVETPVAEARESTEPVEEQPKETPVTSVVEENTETAEPVTQEAAEPSKEAEEPKEETAPDTTTLHPLMEDDSEQEDEVTQNIASVSENDGTEESSTSNEVKDNDVFVRLQSLEEELKALKDEKNTLEQQNALLNHDKEELQKDNEAAKKLMQMQSESYTKNLSDIVSANDSLKNHINELGTRIQEKQNKIDSLTQEKESLSSELSITKETNLDLANQLNAAQSTSNEEMDNIRKEKDNLVLQLDQEKKEKIELQDKLSSLEQQVKEKEDDIASDQQTYDDLSAKMVTLSSALEEKEKEATELQNRITQLEQKLQEKDNSLLQNQQSQDDLSAKLASLNSTLESKEKEASDHESTLQQEILSLKQEKEALEQDSLTLKNNLEEGKAREENLLNELNSLRGKDQELQKNYDQLDAQSDMVSDQIATLNAENEALQKKYDEEHSQFDDLTVKYNNLQQELDSANVRLAGDEKTKEELLKLQTERDVIREDKARAETRVQVLNDKVAQMQTELENKDEQISKDKSTYNQEISTRDATIDSLQKERDENTRMILFLSLRGNKEHYQDVLDYLTENQLPFNEESLTTCFASNPSWRIRQADKIEPINGQAEVVLTDDVTYLKEDSKKRDKAIDFYDQIYGQEKSEVSDFAGRYIRLLDYGHKDSPYDWDYAFFDPDKGETIDNVFVANTKSIKDFKPNGTFTTASHTFTVVKENGRNKIESADFISDPYDMSQALRITRDNSKKTSPLIYLFIKAVGINTSTLDQSVLMEFFDLLDRTLKRCCPLSYIEMKTVIGNGKGNYAFITFDGSVPEAYQEALNYAVLVNSYRREYRMHGKLNAAIVLNETEVEFSKRHLDFDTLIAESHDDELRALRYEFNMTVINSTIKRTIHIGPKILDKLPLDQNLLKPSQIGKGNYASIYPFKGEFKVYNFVYSLTHREENSED